MCLIKKIKFQFNFLSFVGLSLLLITVRTKYSIYFQVPCSLNYAVQVSEERSTEERRKFLGKRVKNKKLQVTSTLIKTVRMIFFSINKTLQHQVYTVCNDHAKTYLRFNFKSLHIIQLPFVYLG